VSGRSPDWRAQVAVPATSSGSSLAPCRPSFRGSGRDGRSVAEAPTLELDAVRAGRPDPGQGSGPHPLPAGPPLAARARSVHVGQAGKGQLAGTQVAHHPGARGLGHQLGVGLAVVAFAAGQQVRQDEPDGGRCRLGAVVPAAAADRRLPRPHAGPPSCSRWRAGAWGHGRTSQAPAWSPTTHSRPSGREGAGWLMTAATAAATTNGSSRPMTLEGRAALLGHPPAQTQVWTHALGRGGPTALSPRIRTRPQTAHHPRNGPCIDRPVQVWAAYASRAASTVACVGLAHRHSRQRTVTSSKSTTTKNGHTPSRTSFSPGQQATGGRRGRGGGRLSQPSGSDDKAMTPNRTNSAVR